MSEMNRDQGELGEDLPEERDPRELADSIAAWTGLPAFHPAAPRDVRLVLSFDSEEERDELVKQIGVLIAKKTKGTWSAWWPPREREDLSALRFDFGATDANGPAEDAAEAPGAMNGTPGEEGTFEREPTGDSARDGVIDWFEAGR